MFSGNPSTDLGLRNIFSLFNGVPPQTVAGHSSYSSLETSLTLKWGRDGTITQHRKLLEVGAHCRPWNRCSIGICYEGGLDADGHPADTRTAEQTEQLTLLLMRLAKLFPGARIRGHRDMSGSIPKACPCFDAEGVFGYLER